MIKKSATVPGIVSGKIRYLNLFSLPLLKFHSTMYVTIKDIAEKLGLSKSTVSRALSGDYLNVSQETVDRVVEAAARMGYKRNELAVNLRKRKSMAVGILVPELQTAFYSRFIAEAQSLLQKNGYRTIIALSNEDTTWEKSSFGLLSDYRVDGILISVCHNRANIEDYSDLNGKQIPLVFFDRTIEDLPCSSVRSDEQKAVLSLMDHLIARGRRRIVHMAGPDYIRNASDRYVAYQSVLAQHGLAFDPDLVVKAGLYRPDGFREISSLLRSGLFFDAVVCFNEMQALGCIEALQAAGIRVPEDVSVASMYGTEVSSLVHPSITSIEKSVLRMAEEAVRLILRQIANPMAPPSEVVIPSDVVIRESS